jgi:ankyrin repeat protein
MIENITKKSKNSAILLIYVLCIYGCSQTVITYPGDPLSPDDVAIIIGEDGVLEIKAIDKQQKLFFLRPGVEIHVLPGIHRIILNVRSFQDASGNLIYSKHNKILEFEALAGHKYKIEYSGKGNQDIMTGTWTAQLIDITILNDKEFQQPITAIGEPVKTTLNFKDGSKYVGEIINGKYHGFGTFTWADGDKYIGHFKNGQQEGKGTYLKKNGAKYQGIYKNNKLNGNGLLVYEDGLSYKGNLKNGRPDGSGTMKYPNSTEFIGTFKNGDKINGRFIIPAEADINDYLKDGFTALLIAVTMGDINLIKDLINAGADINTPNQIDKFTPLSRAIANGHTEIAKYLLKKGANINLKTNFQENPLMIAVRKKNIEIVKFLLNRELDINEKSYDVIKNFELLLKRGININERRRDGSTALLLSVQNKDKEMVALLIKYGASPIIKDNKGRTPLSIAKDNKEIYNLLSLASVKLLQGASKMLIPVDKIKDLKIPSNKP